MRSNSAKQGDQASWGLKLAAWGGLVFLHFPIVIICLYAFNTEDAAFRFPPQGFTLDWFSVSFAREDVLESIKLSLQIACVATLIAMVLGTLAAAALYRRDFFGKEGISLLLILPIALPGIITGLALLSAQGRLAELRLEGQLPRGHKAFDCDQGRLQLRCEQSIAPSADGRMMRITLLVSERKREAPPLARVETLLNPPRQNQP